MLNEYDFSNGIKNPYVKIKDKIKFEKDKNFSNYQKFTVEIDEDVLNWFKATDPTYTYTINHVLREYMSQHSKQ